MSFERLTINHWKQFDSIEVEFHPRLTILTGANGSGKTTILNMLSKHFGWDYYELSTPVKDKTTGKFSFISRWFGKSRDLNKDNIGTLYYDNGKKADIIIPDKDNAQYQIVLKNRQNVLGFYIPSHRPVFYYSPVTQLSTRKRKKQEAFNLVSNSYKQAIFGGSNKPSNYFIKETLLTWAIYGFGNEVIERDQEQLEFYHGFENILNKILPPHIGFKNLSIRNSEIVLVTDSGEFMLDSVSGGLSSLIDLAWQIYMFQTKEKQGFTVLIDEVENHLHATMQRHILHDLLLAFPSAKFIVTTHSPLIVGSVRDSNVYVLQYNEKIRVYSQKLDLINKAKTASEILREVLGVPFTMPLWVEEEFDGIVNKYSKKVINNQSLNEMRTELYKIGLDNLVPKAIVKVVDENNDKTN